MAKPPPPPEPEDMDEWPDPPYPGFRPLDDRMSDRKHTRRAMEVLWQSILKRWANPWQQE